MSRVRFVAAALAGAALVGGGWIATSVAAPAATASSFVPITPCRLFDTRPGDANVGDRATPLGAAETHVVDVWGTHGNCTIPSGATGISASVTIVNPSAASYLTVFPADALRPKASHLNWVGGQAPTPNGVTSALSADGRLAFFNLAGTVDVLVDLIGYYEPAAGGGVPGPAGPQGPAGPRGATGATGATGSRGPAGGLRPDRTLLVAHEGGDYTSVSAAMDAIGGVYPDATESEPWVIVVAPGTYSEVMGITLKPYVSIEGSGAGATIITAVADQVIDATGALGDVEIRDLTLRHQGLFGKALRVRDVTDGSVTVRNAILRSDDPSGTVVYAADVQDAHVVFHDTRAATVNGVAASALYARSGADVRIDGGAWESRVAITASDGSKVEIVGARATGDTHAVEVYTAAQVTIAASTLDGEARAFSGGTVSCEASFSVAGGAAICS